MCNQSMRQPIRAAIQLSVRQADFSASARARACLRSRLVAVARHATQSQRNRIRLRRACSSKSLVNRLGAHEAPLVHTPSGQLPLFFLIEQLDITEALLRAFGYRAKQLHVVAGQTTNRLRLEQLGRIRERRAARCHPLAR